MRICIACKPDVECSGLLWKADFEDVGRISLGTGQAQKEQEEH